MVSTVAMTPMTSVVTTAPEIIPMVSSVPLSSTVAAGTSTSTLPRGRGTIEKCGECVRMFLNKQSLQDHKRSVHEDSTQRADPERLVTVSQTATQADHQELQGDQQTEKHLVQLEI